MAYTERYVRADAAGGGDGTTDTSSGANGAWTFAEGITNEAAGMRINMKAGTYANTTTSRTLPATGTTTAPIWWRGFKTTPGDQDTNNVAVAGTDIPEITFTTGFLTIGGTHHILSNLDVTSAAVSASRGTIYASFTTNLIYGCRIANTAANANGVALFIADTRHAVIRSKITATTSAPAISIGTLANQALIGNVITGGSIGISMSSSAAFLIANNVIASPAGNAVTVSTGYGYFLGNSVYAPGGHGIEWTGTPNALCVLANNYFEDVNQASKYAINNSSGTNTNLIRAIANAYYNCTGTVNGLGDSPLIFDNGTLASAAFTNPAGGDFSIGAVAKGLGFPGLFEGTSGYRGYLDLGAVQREEPTAGGSVVVPNSGIFSHMWSG